MPVHYNPLEYSDRTIGAAKLKERNPREAPPRTANRKRDLAERPMSQVVVFLAIGRRTHAAGLPPSAYCHTFLPAEITAYRANGDTLENGQAIAAYESPRTTKLYGRTGDEITLDEVEKIRI